MMDYLIERNMSDWRSEESVQAEVESFIDELRVLEKGPARIPRYRVVELSSRYWNLLGEIIIGKCSSEDTKELSFTEEEERFFCFGAPPPDSKTAAKVNTKGDDISPDFYFLSEWLHRSYHNLRGTLSAVRKRERKEQLESRLDEARRQLKKRRTFRDNLLNLYCNDGHNETLLLAERLDVVYEKIVGLELMPMYGYALAPEDTEQLVALHRLYIGLREEFDALSRRMGEAGKIDAIERVIGRIEKGAERIKEIEFKLRRVVEDVEDSACHTQYISDRKKRISLVQELYDLKSKLEFFCARNNSFLRSIYLDASEMVKKKALRRALNRLIEFDPRIFNNMSVARDGVPDFLILPFEGVPFYEAEGNSFILPVVMRENPLKMMAEALARYRMEIDRNFALRDSYMMKRRDRAPIRSKETNDMFVSDYVLWQTRETRGGSVLPPGVRKWFEDTIAPYFNELRLPPGSFLRFDDEHDYDSMLDNVEEMLEKDPGDMISRFNRGVLLYMAGSYAPAAMEFDKILTGKSPYIEALYNYAIVCEMMNRKSEAISAWERYLSLDKGSWWRENASKHFDRLHSVANAKQEI